MKNRKNGKTFAFILVIVILAYIVGIAAIVTSYIDANDQLSSEHQLKLLNLAYSADRNLHTMLDRCDVEMNYLIELTKADLENLEKTGNKKPLFDQFHAFPLLKNDFVTDILLMSGNSVLICTEDDSDHTFSFKQNKAVGMPCLCVSQNNKDYLLLSYPCANENYQYAILMDLQTFSLHVNGDESTSDYQLILYDRHTGLLIHSDKNRQGALIIEDQNTIPRESVVSILTQSEQTNKILTTECDYLDPENENETNGLIAALPTAKNENGIFSVGVSENSKSFIFVLRSILWKTIGSSLLIMSGITLLLLYLFRTTRNTKELKKQTELLQKQIDVKQELLDKQQELIHHQRLETIGTLTAGIAHEFNNLLTPIMGYSIMSMEKVTDNDELMDNLNAIYEASSRAKSLITRLSALSRKNNEASFSNFSPDDLILKVQQIAKPSIPDNVELVCDLHCPDPCLYANETQIAQLCLNIVINGLHAMKEKGGLLTITTGFTEQNIVFRFADMGTGIEPEVLPHLFDPFFTTKQKGHGTGLGLAIAKQIVDEHGGTISVDSKLGYGATFTVIFPNKAGKKETTLE